MICYEYITLFKKCDQNRFNINSKGNIRRMSGFSKLWNVSKFMRLRYFVSLDFVVLIFLKRATMNVIKITKESAALK